MLICTAWWNGFSTPHVADDLHHPALPISFKLLMNHSVSSGNFTLNINDIRYNFQKANLASLYIYFEIYDWYELTNLTSVEESSNYFCEVLNHTFEVFI